MRVNVRKKWFIDEETDMGMEETSRNIWEHLVKRIEVDRAQPLPQGAVLDVGCHTGGLLAAIARRWMLNRLYGIEPLEGPRLVAQARLQQSSRKYGVFHPDQWSSVGTESVDLVLCVEVFSYVADVQDVIKQLKRVLKPNKSAYIVFGMHSENPMWTDVWSKEMERLGHKTYSHSPLSIMRYASEAGLKPFVRPLSVDDWVCCDPRVTNYGSMRNLLDNHLRHKLLYRLVKEP